MYHLYKVCLKGWFAVVVTKSSESEIKNVLVSVVLCLLLVWFVCLFCLFSFLLVGLYFLLLFSVHLPRLFSEVNNKTNITFSRLFTKLSIRQEIIMFLP